jgi:uncharacterized damage-inducible protein DinB
MATDLNTLQRHIEYTRWATQRLMDAAASLTPDEQARDFGTADRTVLGTLKHIYGADWAWMERLNGRSPSTYPADGPATLFDLAAAFPVLHHRWRDHVAALTPETAGQEIAYTTFRGDAFRSPVWQIVMHVVNHATHHRGQVAGFLRTMGKTPPALDLMLFYRQLVLPS